MIINQNYQLYGKRILHYLSPVRWKNNVFMSEFDSNFQAVLRTIKWLPMCHHYVVIPEKSDITYLNNLNITLLKYPYPLNVVSNRAWFDSKAFSSIIKIREIDIDYIFLHQPEVLGNIMTSLSDKRYGEIVNKFLFFHWIDCPASRGSPALTHTYMRQLESINIATKVYFHSDASIKYLESNFKNAKSVTINTDYIKTKTSYMPTSNAPFVDDEPISLPKKKIIVFNHRWKGSTGFPLFEEFVEDLNDDYLIWVTDNDAPDKYHKQQLNRGQYSYLLKNSHCSVCFVDGFATWNLSVQDGIKLGKPVLVYRHPTMEKVIGDNYPFFFSTKREFLNLLKTIPTKLNWELPNHDDIWKENLYKDMISCAKNTKAIPKTALDWAYCIKKGIQYKKEITNQAQRNIATNSNWQYVRRFLLWNGFVDDPESTFTKYSVKGGCEEQVDEMIKSVKLDIKPSTVKEVATFTKSSNKFFKL